ncbi:somatoliberin isoform X3 [Vanacampus margaritifer]
MEEKTTFMMEKAVLLLLYCLFISISGAPLYPSIRFGQRDTSILMTSSLKNPEQLEDTSSSQERTDLRYRKVLGQISARKFLQTIMGKRLEDERESHSDIYEGTYKEDLTSIQRNPRY